MDLVEAGKVMLKDGAEKIGMSYRQAKQIRKRVQKKGGRVSWFNGNISAFAK
jgi:hypothetical protein